MGWDAPDLGHQPEAFGLTVIGDVEWSQPCYSFDTTVVSVDDKGTFYVYSDSGCSCPMPFERFTSLDSADLITSNVADVIALLQKGQGESHEKEFSGPQVVDLISKLVNR